MEEKSQEVETQQKETEETPKSEAEPQVEQPLPQQSSPSRQTASAEPPTQTVTRETRPQAAPTQDLYCQAVARLLPAPEAQVPHHFMNTPGIPQQLNQHQLFLLQQQCFCSRESQSAYQHPNGRERFHCTKLQGQSHKSRQDVAKLTWNITKDCTRQDDHHTTPHRNATKKVV